MEKRKYGFVLLPDRKTMVEAIRLSGGISGNKLTLDLAWKLPHVTILQTYFKRGFDYNAALKQARLHRGFRNEPYSRFNGITVQDTEEVTNILWWNILNAEWLKDLNREMIESFEDFIEKPETTEGIVLPNEAARISYERTGYGRNLDAYEPHITLAVTEEKVKPPLTAMSGERVKFHRIAFVEHAPMGQIGKVLASEDLPISWD
jgi:hypothetical protein